MSSDFSIENVELAFLNLLLKNPELIYESSFLTVGMFTSTPNQVLFATISELAAQGLVPEKQFLIDYLASKNKLSLAGGKQYINIIFEQNFNLDNFPKYREMLVNAYKSRTIMSVVSDIPSRLSSGHNVDKVLFDLKSDLDSLDVTNANKTTFRVSESLKSVWNEIVSRTSNPGLTGISTGFHTINLFTGGYPSGDFWVIGSRPSQGKTSFICNSAILSSTNNGIPLIFSLEMNIQTMVERLLAEISKVPLTYIRLGTVTQEQLDAVHSARLMLEKLPIYVDTNFSTNVTYATAVIRKYVKNYNVNTVWIDYVQLMSERGADQTAEIGRICRAMKLLAKDLNIFIGMTAQLNRLVEMRDDKRPILSDLRQSGNLEEDADLVAFLYRDDYYYADSKNKGVLEFIVRKQRNGPVGMIPLKFEEETTIIKDL